MGEGILSAVATHQDSSPGDALELGPSHWSPNGVGMKFCVLCCALSHTR